MHQSIRKQESYRSMPSSSCLRKAGMTSIADAAIATICIHYSVHHICPLCIVIVASVPIAPNRVDVTIQMAVERWISYKPRTYTASSSHPLSLMLTNGSPGGSPGYPGFRKITFLCCSSPSQLHTRSNFQKFSYNTESQQNPGSSRLVVLELLSRHQFTDIRGNHLALNVGAAPNTAQLDLVTRLV